MKGEKLSTSAIRSGECDGMMSPPTGGRPWTDACAGDASPGGEARKTDPRRRRTAPRARGEPFGGLRMDRP